MNRPRCVLFFAAACVSLACFVHLASRAAEPANVTQPGVGQPDGTVPVRAIFAADSSGAGVLSVQVPLADGWHTYSVTEAAEPNRTRITLAPSGQYRQAGAIRADIDPRRSYDPQSRQTVETHEGTVTWRVPIRFAEGVDPARLQIRGLIELMACDAQACQPVAAQFTAIYQAAAQGSAKPGPGRSAVGQNGGSVIADPSVAPAAATETEQFPTAVEKPNKFDDILGGRLGGGAGAESSDPVSVTASVKPAEKDQPPQLIIEATIGSGWHIYSITQPKGGPLATKIDVKITGDASLAGDFKSDPLPKTHFDSEVFKINLEEHEGKVRWIAPLKIGKGAEAAGLKIHGTVSAQACNKDTCLPPKALKFVALDTTKKAGAHVGEYQPDGSSVILRGYAEPSTVAPGGTVKLVLTAAPQGGFHVYPVKEKPKVAKPTRIVLSDLPEGWTASGPIPNVPPELSNGDAYHVGPVTWTMEVKVPDNAKAGLYKLEGGIAYMACKSDDGVAGSGRCESPTGAIFESEINVGAGGTSEQRPLSFIAGTYGEVEKRTLTAAQAAQKEALQNQVRPVIGALLRSINVESYSHSALNKVSSVNLDQLPQSKSEASTDWASLLASLSGGFLGGLLLNVMPCVLPVIGLKILSFAQQGGESRGRVFLLNVWFSLGLIAVFLVLAAFAAFAKLGWGGQFQQAWFGVALACVVFAFALAMVGVWEVPIPGFIGSSTASDLASKEGPAGAFSKGVLTTLLATPCTGPFLGPALAWAVSQPVPIVFAMFASVGLGMASPYLVIGAFPNLIAFLPKPGEWMETFKKLMGFVLMASVVWLLSFVPAPKVVPVVTIMCGLGLAFWWIGRVPLTEPGSKRLSAWGQGALLIVGVSFFSFGWLDRVMEERADRRFKSEMVSKLVKFAAEPEKFQTPERPAGRYTVMVDFTADWCLTCKTNEQFVLSSKKTKDLIEKNNVVFLVADLTTGHAEAEDLLIRLGNKQRTIPYVAIFPADDPNQPIVLDGLLTQSRLDEALKKAGPSKVEPGVTAMRNETASR